MKEKITIHKRGREWVVIFSIGVQYFTLEPCGQNKAEAQWQARMLRKAFKNLKNNVK